MNTFIANYFNHALGHDIKSHNFTCIPEASSELYIIPLASEILIQCARAFSLKLKLIKAPITPILAIPSHMHTYSGQFSIKTAMTSPWQKKKINK